MRRFFLIASVVGLIMYAGFVLEHGSVATSAVGTSELAGLESALAATGASLERVTITGWVAVEASDAREQVSSALGWAGQGIPAGETRELKLHRREDGLYLAMNWRLSGGSLEIWPSRYALARRALAKVGGEPSVTVQLEGTTEQSDLLALGQQALDEVKATDREPWTGPSAASVAGRSALLPASPFGVNVQVAVRSEASGRKARVWVAWPALLQEY